MPRGSLSAVNEAPILSRCTYQIDNEPMSANHRPIIGKRTNNGYGAKPRNRTAPKKTQRYR